MSRDDNHLLDEPPSLMPPARDDADDIEAYKRKRDADEARFRETHRRQTEIINRERK